MGEYEGCTGSTARGEYASREQERESNRDAREQERRETGMHASKKGRGIEKRENERGKEIETREHRSGRGTARKQGPLDGRARP